jgi:hypothetical protein
MIICNVVNKSVKYAVASNGLHYLIQVYLHLIRLLIVLLLLLLQLGAQGIRETLVSLPFQNLVCILTTKRHITLATIQNN